MFEFFKGIWVNLDLLRKKHSQGLLMKYTISREGALKRSCQATHKYIISPAKTSAPSPSPSKIPLSSQI